MNRAKFKQIKETLHAISANIREVEESDLAYSLATTKEDKERLGKQIKAKEKAFQNLLGQLAELTPERNK